MTIKALVGLGNPGASYAATRHNAGARWIELVAREFNATLTAQPKFKGLLARVSIFGHEVRLLVPTTYMNASGQAVGALCQFYKIAPQELLIAHDEVAFEPGVVKLKQGGGHNGHNGLRDIIAALGNSADFARLRIGVGHPGTKADVIAYLTSRTPPAAERDLEAESGERALRVLDDLVPGQFMKAMNRLHAPPEPTL